MPFSCVQNLKWTWIIANSLLFSFLSGATRSLAIFGLLFETWFQLSQSSAVLPQTPPGAYRVKGIRLQLQRWIQVLALSQWSELQFISLWMGKKWNLPQKFVMRIKRDDACEAYENEIISIEALQRWHHFLSPGFQHVFSILGWEFWLCH